MSSKQDPEITNIHVQSQLDESYKVKGESRETLLLLLSRWTKSFILSEKEQHL